MLGVEFRLTVNNEQNALLQDLCKTWRQVCFQGYMAVVKNPKLNLERFIQNRTCLTYSQLNSAVKQVNQWLSQDKAELKERIKRLEEYLPKLKLKIHTLEKKLGFTAK